MRRLIQTKELGLKKKMIGLLRTSRLMVKVAGDLSQRPLVFSAVAKAAAFDGLIT